MIMMTIIIILLLLMLISGMKFMLDGVDITFISFVDITFIGGSISRLMRQFRIVGSNVGKMNRIFIIFDIFDLEDIIGMDSDVIVFDGIKIEFSREHDILFEVLTGHWG